jgi:hypothetical protein
MSLWLVDCFSWFYCLYVGHLILCSPLPPACLTLCWVLCVVQLSRALRDHARTIPGKSQLFINAFAKALEVSRHTTPCGMQELQRQ